MWELLDSVQLKSGGSNCNTLKEKRPKMLKKYTGETCLETPLPLVIREKANLICIDNL